jgi:hypothetical protein
MDNILLIHTVSVYQHAKQSTINHQVNIEVWPHALLVSKFYPPTISNIYIQQNFSTFLPFKIAKRTDDVEFMFVRIYNTFLRFQQKKMAH